MSTTHHRPLMEFSIKLMRFSSPAQKVHTWSVIFTELEYSKSSFTGEVTMTCMVLHDTAQRFAVCGMWICGMSPIAEHTHSCHLLLWSESAVSERFQEMQAKGQRATFTLELIMHPVTNIKHKYSLQSLLKTKYGVKLSVRAEYKKTLIRWGWVLIRCDTKQKTKCKFLKNCL